MPTARAVATVDGGDFYWHARGSGIDTGAMAAADLLPSLAGKGLAADRIAWMGWSMGGYGALLLASRLGPCRVAGVVATSAALWQSAGGSAPGAFDDGLDFARSGVFTRRHTLAGMPARLDCGAEDPSSWPTGVRPRTALRGRHLRRRGSHRAVLDGPCGSPMRRLRQRLT
jgi:pimeloyl-ACP methyl ester carboxylesterase